MHNYSHFLHTYILVHILLTIICITTRLIPSSIASKTYPTLLYILFLIAILSLFKLIYLFNKHYLNTLSIYILYTSQNWLFPSLMLLFLYLYLYRLVILLMVSLNFVNYSFCCFIIDVMFYPIFYAYFLLY